MCLFVCLLVFSWAGGGGGGGGSCFGRGMSSTSQFGVAWLQVTRCLTPMPSTARDVSHQNSSHQIASEVK